MNYTTEQILESIEFRTGISDSASGKIHSLLVEFLFRTATDKTIPFTPEEIAAAKAEVVQSLIQIGKTLEAHVSAIGNQPLASQSGEVPESCRGSVMRLVEQARKPQPEHGYGDMDFYLNLFEDEGRIHLMITNTMIVEFARLHVTVEDDVLSFYSDAPVKNIAFTLNYIADFCCKEGK